jgi:hypothetical protein
MQNKNTSFLVALTLLVSMSLPLSTWIVEAQNPPCVNPAAQSYLYAWPRDATVYVYTGQDDTIGEEFVEKMKEVLANYTNASFPEASPGTSNNSGVVFKFVGRGGCDTTVDQNGTLHGFVGMFTICVQRQVPWTGGAGETGGQNLATGGWRSSAVINMHPGITDAEAFAQTFAHEIGHTMGLGECPACTIARQSVMTPAASLNDTAQGLKGPTACDNAVIHTAGNYNPAPCANLQERIACNNLNRIWDHINCKCTDHIDTGPGDPNEPGGSGCWTFITNDERYQGFCHYYLTIHTHYCQGQFTGEETYVDGVECDEEGLK